MISSSNGFQTSFRASLLVSIYPYLLTRTICISLLAVDERVIVENYLKRQHQLEERDILKKEMRKMVNFFRKSSNRLVKILVSTLDIAFISASFEL